MTLEEHMFMSKYLFNKTVEVKMKLKHPLADHELMNYKQIDDGWRKFYEE